MNQTWTRYLPAFLRQKLEGRAVLQKAISNTGWLFADNVLRIAVGLLVSVWVTRYLGPEQFGILSFATAFVMLFSSIALLGLDFIVVRNIVRDPSSRDETLGTAFVLKLIGGIAASGLTMAAIVLLRPTDNLTRLLVGIITIGTLFQAFGTIDFWFQSQVQSKYSAYARSSAYLVICAAKIVLILLHAPLVAYKLNPNHVGTLFNATLIYLELGDVPSACNLAAQMQRLDLNLANKLEMRIGQAVSSGR